MNNMSNKAQQFLPFDALKGFKEAIKSKEKETICKKELSIDELEELSYIINSIHKNDLVKITFYQDNNYETIIGYVTNIDSIFKNIIINKKKILFDDIKIIALLNK